MPLGLVPGVRTQVLGRPGQEVRHCATHVMVAYREKNGRIYTALTTKLLTSRYKFLLKTSQKEGLDRGPFFPKELSFWYF